MADNFLDSLLAPNVQQDGVSSDPRRKTWNMSAGLEVTDDPSTKTKTIGIAGMAALSALDPSGVTDGNTALQNALTSASTNRKKLTIPGGGTFRSDSRLTLADGASLLLEIPLGVTLTFADASFAARLACITIGTHNTTPAGEDGLTELAVLAVNAAKGATVITLDDDVEALVDPGDLILLVNDDEYSWNPNLDGTGGNDDRPYYHAGEQIRVHSVDGEDVRLDRPLQNSYTAGSNIKIYKITRNYVHIFGGGKIICPHLGTFDTGIHVQNGFGKIEDVEITGHRYAGVELWRCKDLDLVGLKTATYNPAGNEGAGVFMIGSEDCVDRGGHHRNGKHAVSLTGGNVFAATPNRRCGAKGSILVADVTAADMHGHCHSCFWDDCEIIGAASLGGSNYRLKGGSVQSCSDQWDEDLTGQCIRLRELRDANGLVETTVNSIHEVAPDIVPIEFDFYANIVGGKFVARIEMNGGVANPKIAYVSTELEGLVDADIHIDYTGPVGEKAPTAELNCGASGAFNHLKISGSGFSPQRSDLRGRLIEYDVRCIGGETYGCLIGCDAWSEQQILNVKGYYAENDTTGIRAAGPGVGEDVILTVEGATSINNGQDSGAAASERTSFKATDIKVVNHRNNIYDDTQAVPTQQGLVALDTITTLRGQGNGTLGYTAYQRSMSSVTNDREIVQLTGSGSPEGVFPSDPGAVYFDRVNGHQYFKISGTGTTGWRRFEESLLGVFPSYGKTTAYKREVDFRALADGLSGLTEFASGAGTGATYLAAPTTRVGLVALNTGTTNAGLNGFYEGLGVNQSVKFGGGIHRLRWDIAIPTLSDANESFQVQLGWSDVGAGGSVDAATFSYTHSSASGNWVIETLKAGVSEATDSTVAVAAGSMSAGTGTHYILEAAPNAAATQMLFYINGVVRATHSTQIPLNAMSVFCQILKTGGAVGTTNRSLQVDTYAYLFEPTTPV